MRTSWPNRRNAFDKPPTTSARPPTFAYGTHSDETKRIFNSSSCSPFVGRGFRSAGSRRDTGGLALVTGDMRSESVTGHTSARKHPAGRAKETTNELPRV